MKKFLFYGLLILMSACDDGDLQIETIDFDSASIQHCATVDAATANVLFKLNTNEALIVELPNGTLKNEVATEGNTYNVSASGPIKITYRTFSDDVSTDYFCSEIPVSTPTVTEEIVAESGTVLITTVLNADGVTYEHEIKLNTISFVTAKDTRITNLSITNFGTVTTVASE